MTSAHPVSMYAQSVSDGSVADESSENSSSQDGSEESSETGDNTSTEGSTESGATEEQQYNDLGEPLDEKPNDDSRMPSEGEERDGETTVSENDGESGKYERAGDTTSENEAVSETVCEDSAIVDSVSIDSLSEDSVSDNGIGGNIEATFDFSDDYELNASFTMPAAYSSEKYVLDPEDVGESKNCWAYTAMGMAETSRMLQTETTKDNFTAYSPQHLVRQFFNPIRTDRAGLTYYNGINAMDTRYRDRSIPGILSTNTTDVSAIDNPAVLDTASGNLAYTTFELARWQGPKSSSLPLNNGDTDQLQKFDENDTEAHLRNAYWVPNSDKSSICKLIKQTGSVGIQVYLAESGMAAVRAADGTDNYGYHYYNNSVTVPNYTVQLIGWDPNIKADMFNYNGTKPSGNGAFLAKSSYKASNGTYQKYFWISQYDAAFEYKDNTRIAVAYEFDDADNYDYQYGYDGSNGSETYTTKRAYAVFTAGEAGQQGGGSDQAEILRAVGVGVGDAGTYEIGVYYYNSNATYLNQYPIETQTVKIPYTGYHTIELEHPILLLRDDRVAVSVRRSDGNSFKAFVDKKAKSADKSIEFKPYAVYGESYLNNPSTGKLVSGNWALRSDINLEPSDDSIFESTKKNKKPKKYDENEYYNGMTPRLKMYTDVVERPALVDQTKIKVELTKYVWYYTGNNINPTPRIMVSVKNGEGDTENCIVTPDHYTTTYVNHKNAGIGAVVVRGGTVDSSGNVTKQPDVFSGEISEEFKIVSTQINIARCKIYGIGAQEYDSSNNYEQNNIVVMYKVPETMHYVKLKQGLDYTVGSVEITNKNGNKASILITGAGAFRNSIKKKFKITNAPVKKKNGTTVSKNGKKSISDRSVTVTLTDSESGEAWDTVQRVAYDKTKKYKPKVTVSDNAKDGTDKTLTEGTDYKVSYKKGKNPGLAQVVIKGKGAYTGKTIAYFIVDPIRITTDAVIKMSPSSYKYTGDELKPKPRVTLYGKPIPKGSLYCHYNNNTGSSSGTATAQIIVFGRNKYIGYVGYTTFKITASSSTSTS